MLNFFAMVVTMCGIGLLAAGSAWCVPAFMLAFAGWGLADRLSFDVEVLGGVMLLFMLAGGAYAILRSLWIVLVG